MKERLDSSFAHLLFVQAAVSAKKLLASQLWKARRKSEGWTHPQDLSTKATQSGEWESFLPGPFRLVWFAVPNSPFIGTYKQSKDTGLQEHSLLLCCLPLFLCHSFSECLSSFRDTTGFVLLSWEVFHSVPAIMNAFHPISRPWIDMTVLLKNLKIFCALFFFFF